MLAVILGWNELVVQLAGTTHLAKLEKRTRSEVDDLRLPVELEVQYSPVESISISTRKYVGGESSDAA